MSRYYYKKLAEKASKYNAAGLAAKKKLAKAAKTKLTPVKIEKK